MVKKASRRWVLALYATSLMGISGCGQLNNDGSNDTPEQSNQQTTENIDTQDQNTQQGTETSTDANSEEEPSGTSNNTTNTEVRTTETTNSGSQRYDASFDTEKVVLDQDQVPEGFTLYSEEVKSSENSDGTRDLDEGILAYHNRWFINDENWSISSTVTIFENRSYAISQRDEKINRVVQSGGERLSFESAGPIETEVIENETEEENRVRYYFGHDENLLLELTTIGGFSVEQINSIYDEMISEV